MEQLQTPLSTLELSNALDFINSTEEDLIKKKDDYEKKFRKQVELMYPLFRKTSVDSKSWNYKMSFNIGTIEADIPHKTKSEIALGRNPDYLEYLCHTMVGCLVLRKPQTCNLGSDDDENADILPVIERTAWIIGLGVDFCKSEERVFRGKSYKDRYVTFFIRK